MDVANAQVSMNIFDAIILGVFGLSVLVAFFRGFIRELLSLGAWVGAAIVTAYAFPHVVEALKGTIQKEVVAAGVAALGTYLGALLVFSLFNAIIIRYLKSGSDVGILDNFLGLFFGAVRGAFVVCLAFLIMTAVIPKDTPWLQTSVTRPALQKGADLLARVAPKYLGDLESIVRPAAQNAEDAAGDAANAAENLPEGEYRQDMREQFQRLIDSTQPKEKP